MDESRKGKKVVKTIEHPLEEFFEIESGTTEVEVFERDGEVLSAEGYDSKDAEIEKQFQEIYDSAMEGYDVLAEEMERVEGKYVARVGEVSVQHLNAALNAAQAKMKLKEHKDKLESKGTSSPSHVTTNNNLIVDDRELFMRELQKTMASEIGKKNE